MPPRPFDDRRLVLILAAIAFALRIIFLVRFAASPLFVPVSGGNDCWLYYSIAQRCAEGHWLPDGVFQYMPLYAWLLGAIVCVAGTKALLFAAWLGALVDTATVALIFKLARRCGAPRWAAFGGALLFATYPLAITYSALNMPNTLNAFFVLALANIFHGFTSRTPLWKWIATGIFAGVVCLSFAGMLLISIVVAVAFIIAFLVRCPRFSVSAIAKVFAFIAAAALPIAPISLHNFRAEGKFVLITAHGGFNFWLGNDEKATGYPWLPDGFRGDRGNLLADAQDEVARAVGHKPAAAEFSKYWNDRAKKFIRENPGREAALIAKKFLKFWNAAEYDDLRMLPMLRLTGTAFTWPVWPGFGIISVFGFAGLLTARRCGVVRLIAATSMISIVMFFITSRYRLTVVPLLCVVGAVGLRPVFIAIADRKFQISNLISQISTSRRGLAWLCAVPLGFIVAFWPIAGTDFRALDCYNTATHLLEKATQTGDGALVEDALGYAIKGIRIDPASPDLHFLAGNASFGMGKTNEARAAFQNAIKLNPKHAQAWFNLAVMDALGGNKSAAISNATRAVQLDPGFDQAKDFLKRIQNEPATR